jgi:hypothetical protein
MKTHMSNSTNNNASHRIQHRLAVVDSEVPNFQGIKNGIYISDINGKIGHVFYFDQGSFKIKSEQKESTGSTGSINCFSLKNIIVDEQRGIFIGSKPISNSPGSIVIGDESGEVLMVGSDNILLGRNIGVNMTEGNDVISLGANTLRESSAIGNSISIGAGSMGKCGKTEMNIGIGKDTLSKINDAYNIAIGIEAGKEMTGPLINHNICIGRGAMKEAQASAINIISLGTHSCESMQGNNFQSIYFGDKAAQFLNSKVISAGNIGLGSQVLSEAHDVSDSICMGTLTGKNISGVRLVVLGNNAGIDCSGSLTEEILIGHKAGNQRIYTESKNVFLGSMAGFSGAGVEGIGIGVLAGSQSVGDFNISLGSQAGQHIRGDQGLFIGNNAGQSSSGSFNFCLGGKAGQGLIGSYNLWLGSTEKMGDVLDQTVLLGHDAFGKGRKGVIIGHSAGSSSVGFINGDVLIGHSAGMGQHYSDNCLTGKGMVLIGDSAGKGDKENPNDLNSSDLVCIGDSAGSSSEQQYHRAVMIGNHAGSFGGFIEDSILVGHSVGIGMTGSSNICVGAKSGTNLKGSRNILIGTNSGDRTEKGELNDTLVVGNEKPVLLGDLQKGNLVIGAPSIIPRWTDGENTLGFVSTLRPRAMKGVDGLMYVSDGELEFLGKSGVSCLSFPQKFVHRGNVNGISFKVDIGKDGISLLNVKIIPRNKINYLLSAEIVMSVLDGVISIGPVNSDKWKISVVNDMISFKSDTVVEGILYLEIIGEQIVQKL